MFERFKAYRNLRKSNKFLKGLRVMAVLMDDESMLKEANEALYINEKLKKEMWYKRKLATSYNAEIIRNGFTF